MAYKLMKRIIEKAKQDGTLEEKKADIMNKLDAFLAADRLSAAEYRELVEMMGGSGNE